MAASGRRATHGRGSLIPGAPIAGIDNRGLGCQLMIVRESVLSMRPDTLEL